MNEWALQKDPFFNIYFENTDNLIYLNTTFHIVGRRNEMDSVPNWT